MSENITKLVPIDGQLQRMQSNLKDFLNERKFCDIEVISDIDEKRLPAHIIVLAAASEYFKSLITVKLKDAVKKPIELNLYVASNILITILNYLYTGSIELSVNYMKELFAAVQLLQLHDIADVCQTFIVENISTENCFDLLYFAKSNEYEKLTEHILNYILNNLLKIFQDDNFLKLEYDYFLSIIEKVDAKGTDRENMFKAIQRWLDYDKVAREKHLDELVIAAQLPLMSSEFLLDVVEPFCNTVKSLKACLNAIKLNAGVMSIEMSNIDPTNVSDEILLAIDAHPTLSNCMNMAVYCPKNKQWHQLENKVPYRHRCSIAILKSNLFILGGLKDDTRLKTVISMDLKTAEWKYEQPMQQVMSVTTAIVIENKIYVIGKTSEFSKTFWNIECYDVTKSVWTILQSPMELVQRTAAAFDNKLYTLDSTDKGTTIKCYNPRNNRWTTIAFVEDIKSVSHICILNGILHCLNLENHFEFNLYVKTLTQSPWERYKFMDKVFLQNAVFQNEIVTGHKYNTQTLGKYNVLTKISTEFPTYYFMKYISNVATISKHYLK